MNTILTAPLTMLAPRHFGSHDDYLQCVRAQHLVWGAEYRDIVPASMLKVTQRVGGLAAGVFDESGELLGFVYGLTGLNGGQPVHWSHMLGVRPDMRNRGIGQKLKEFQRAELQRAGVELLYWTFDPLVSRNAHLNLNKLGVEVIEYVPDMYASTASALHQAGMDRFVVRWTSDADTAAKTRLHSFSDVPVANPFGETDGSLPTSSSVCIEIPVDIEVLLQQSRSDALGWRAATRRAFVHYLSRGYSVRGFRRSGSRAFYLLELNRTSS